MNLLPCFIFKRHKANKFKSFLESNSVKGTKRRRRRVRALIKIFLCIHSQVCIKWCLVYLLRFGLCLKYERVVIEILSAINLVETTLNL